VEQNCGQLAPEIKNHSVAAMYSRHSIAIEIFLALLYRDNERVDLFGDYSAYKHSEKIRLSHHKGILVKCCNP
jgi:hypothetical protein